MEQLIGRQTYFGEIRDVAEERTEHLSPGTAVLFRDLLATFGLHPSAAELEPQDALKYSDDNCGGLSSGPLRGPQTAGGCSSTPGGYCGGQEGSVVPLSPTTTTPQLLRPTRENAAITADRML
ncbi:hypothetical protein NHX12_033581 [Muraenolepis orangiensis]|uniref:Uncharacterized protein n=1 Tax=Muraenolepis orangiensis TaxID=630683 RepID=A0A9Q0E2X3_9TELE|nr:hypothetical protein NHX12_033581 [Muraenolepis orangiensis]